MDGRKFDPKDTAIEAFYTVKELLTQLLSDFRSRDRYFKYKAGIIAGWLVLSSGTLAISCGTGGRGNSLDARADVTQVAGDYTLLVRNDSTDDWSDVRLSLNHNFNAYTPAIAAGGSFVIPVKQFVGSQGQIPPKDLKPQSLFIRCDRGKGTLDLTKPELAQ